MDWLKRYEADLIALRESSARVMPVTPEQIASPEMQEIWNAIYGPVEGSGAAPDGDLVGERMWARFGAKMTEAMREEAAIHLRLMPMYQRAATGTDADAAAYARFRWNVWVPLFRPMLQMLAQSETESAKLVEESKKVSAELNERIGEPQGVLKPPATNQVDPGG